MNWGFWFALSASIIGIGKFIDDYHIRTQTKSKIKEHLILLFIYLDERTIPDVGGYILSKLSNMKIFPKWLGIFILLLFCYWSTVTGFYLGRHYFGYEYTNGYIDYLITWFPLNKSSLYWVPFLCTFIIPSITGTLYLLKYSHKASYAKSDIGKVFYLLLGVGVSGVILYLGVFIGFKFFSGGGYNAVNIYVASIASFILPIIVLILILFLLLMRIIINLFRGIMMNVFNIASSPKVSPLTYATSALGVCVLLIKVLHEAYFV